MSKTEKLKTKARKYIDNFKNFKPIAFMRKLFKLNGFSYMPSSLTFYVVVSAVPLVSLILMILAQFNAPTGFLEDLLQDVLPDSEFAETIIGYFQSIRVPDLLALVFSSTVSIYIASRGIECFSRFADHFYNRHVLDNHLIRRKTRSIVLTLLFVIAFSVTMIVIFFFDRLTSSFIPIGVSKWLKYLLAFVLFFAFITGLFYFAPTKRPKFREVLPGAYLGSISVVIFVGLFLVYISYQFDRYSSIYGPLSTIVILLLLIYFCCYILFMCFYLNILIGDNKDRKKAAAELKKLNLSAQNKPSGKDE